MSDRAPTLLTRDEIAAWQPAALPAPGTDLAAPLRDALTRHGLWTPAQVAGRNWPMGCVSLEITQRCNLDCTLCYLSDRSEAVHDLPLDEVYRRIDEIRAHYGPGTNVQVSGGDPTLRERQELVAIVRRVAERGMNPALFTNGIKATRALLTELAAAGLKDVAFHVDLTQERRGYATEAALNAIRRDYIARARGLGLRILFNTTVFDGNVAEMPDLVRFFVDHAADVHMASFQLQADTGRGVLRKRELSVSQHGVMHAIEMGTGLALDFDMPQIGHTACNRYTGILVAGGRTAPIFTDRAFFAKLFAGAAPLADAWRRHRRVAGTLAFIARHPLTTLRGLRFVARAAWTLGMGLVRGRGRVHKLSFYIHNFMDADNLERDRCETCVFMVATRDGPVSMCVHNAKRDQYLMKPVRTPGGWWNPLTGRTTHAGLVDTPAPEALPLKRLKGRIRALKMAQRTQEKEAG